MRTNVCSACSPRWTGLSLAEQDAFLDSLQENELTKKQMSETISTAFGKMISDLKNLFYPMVLAADESTPGPNYTSLQRMLTDAKYNELNSTVRSLACMHSADRLMRAGRLLHALPQMDRLKSLSEGGETMLWNGQVMGEWSGAQKQRDCVDVRRPTPHSHTRVPSRGPRRLRTYNEACMPACQLCSSRPSHRSQRSSSHTA